MDENTANFWQAWTSTVCPEPVPVSFRLYHRPDGSPRFYTMEDLPGDYVEVDAETYARSPMNVQVQNQRLVYVESRPVVQKLRPATTGVACAVTDVCVIVDLSSTHTKWSTNTNDAD
jgi:hypothetical protein